MQQTRRSQPRRTKQKVAFFFASGVVSLKVMYKICTNFVPTLRLFLTRTGQVIKLGTNSATYLGIVLFLLLAFGEIFFDFNFCSNEFWNVFAKGNCLKRVLELST